MIWIDSSIPKSVAMALQQVRNDIRWVGTLYLFDQNKDTIWLPDAGKADALVILRDKKVRTRPAELRAIVTNRVGCFVLSQKRNLKKWEYLRMLAQTLDEMEEKFESVPRPFIWTVDSTARFSQYYPRPTARLISASNPPR